MNAHALKDDFDISAEMSANVIPLKTDPEAEVERLANAHRGMVAKSLQRIADRRKSLKARLAGLEGDKRALRAAYDRDTAYLADVIADAKATADRDNEADRRLVAASRAALDALAEG